VAKKSKTVQDENSRSAANGPPLTEEKSNKKAPRKRSTNARKSPATAKKKTAAKTKGSKTVEPTDEEIRIRAYFIAERRHRLELTGDADTDWLEAKRQLLSELGPR
jgi:transposase